MKNYYEILEVTPDASPDVIRAAYKALVKKLHPDNGGDAETYRVNILEINEAFDVLSNPAKKEEYDRIMKEESASQSYNYEEYEAFHKSADTSAYSGNNRDGADEKENADLADVKENARYAVIAFVACFIFSFFDFPAWTMAVAAVIGVWYLCDVAAHFIVAGINNRVPSNVSWTEDEKTAVTGVLAFAIIRTAMNAYGIQNWFSGICLFLLGCSIILLVIKIVDTVGKK
ncbi:MAG: J domain-containing protein [Clostridiales bacterium]|nr:J domain-containing protein [Clostridiales bacterium]